MEHQNKEKLQQQEQVKAKQKNNMLQKLKSCYSSHVTEEDIEAHFNSICEQRESYGKYNYDFYIHKVLTESDQIYLYISMSYDMDQIGNMKYCQKLKVKL